MFEWNTAKGPDIFISSMFINWEKWAKTNSIYKRDTRKVTAGEETSPKVRQDRIYSPDRRTACVNGNAAAMLMTPNAK